MLMDESELSEWQEKIHKPGELLSMWDYDTSKEIPCMVIEDFGKDINPFGRKTKIRRIKVMSMHGIIELTRWDIFPPGEARPSIPY
jgi:hypothetical protein